MQNPDFQCLADAYGIKSRKVTQRADLASSIVDFVGHEGSYLLEVVVATENNVFPMVETGKSVAEVRLE